MDIKSKYSLIIALLAIAGFLAFILILFRNQDLALFLVFNSVVFYFLLGLIFGKIFMFSRWPTNMLKIDKTPFYTGLKARFFSLLFVLVGLLLIFQHQKPNFFTSNSI